MNSFPPFFRLVSCEGDRERIAKLARKKLGKFSLISLSRQNFGPLHMFSVVYEEYRKNSWPVASAAENTRFFQDKQIDSFTMTFLLSTVFFTLLNPALRLENWTFLCGGVQARGEYHEFHNTITMRVTWPSLEILYLNLKNFGKVVLVNFILPISKHSFLRCVEQK